MSPAGRRLGRGGTPEAVADGLTGRLVPPGDAGALASALEELASDPKRLIELGRAGFRSAEREFTIERMVRQTASVRRPERRLRVARTARIRCYVEELVEAVAGDPRISLTVAPSKAENLRAPYDQQVLVGRAP